eukprot:GABV01000911.1.p1 GENE.GABV01000911.1~~GABV01000911.1.p1  ORF type:complete len:128 (+),score=38.72 GABV01000911.1:70-453(+)
MSFFGFGSGAEISLEYKTRADQERVIIQPHPNDEQAARSPPSKLLLFKPDETVAGTVNLKIKGSKLEHVGILIEFIGQVELAFDRGNHFVFTPSLIRELSGPGTLTEDVSFPFEFANVEKNTNRTRA